jgi:hypothetical protein
MAAPVGGVLAAYACLTLYNGRNSYVTGVLSARLMTQVAQRAGKVTPGTTIVLVDSPLAAQSARPILLLSHPGSARNVKVAVNVTKGAPEYDAAVNDPSALVFVYERGTFAPR